MRLIILGTGEHSKVVTQVASERCDTEIYGYIDDKANWVNAGLWLGNDSILEAPTSLPSDCAYFVAVGNNKIECLQKN